MMYYLSTKGIHPAELAQLKSGIIYQGENGKITIKTYPNANAFEIEVEMQKCSVAYEVQSHPDALTGFQQDLDHLLTLWKQGDIAAIEAMILQ